MSPTIHHKSHSPSTSTRKRSRQDSEIPEVASHAQVQEWANKPATDKLPSFKELTAGIPYQDNQADVVMPSRIPGYDAAGQPPFDKAFAQLKRPKAATPPSTYLPTPTRYNAPLVSAGLSAISPALGNLSGTKSSVPTPERVAIDVSSSNSKPPEQRLRAEIAFGRRSLGEHGHRRLDLHAQNNFSKTRGTASAQKQVAVDASSSKSATPQQLHAAVSSRPRSHLNNFTQRQRLGLSSTKYLSGTSTPLSALEQAAVELSKNNSRPLQQPLEAKTAADRRSGEKQAKEQLDILDQAVRNSGLTPTKVRSLLKLGFDSKQFYYILEHIKISSVFELLLNTAPALRRKGLSTITIVTILSLQNTTEFLEVLAEGDDLSPHGLEIEPSQLIKMASRDNGAGALRQLRKQTPTLRAAGFTVADIVEMALLNHGEQALTSVGELHEILRAADFTPADIVKMVSSISSIQTLPAVVKTSRDLRAFGFNSADIALLAKSTNINGFLVLQEMVKKEPDWLRKFKFSVADIAKLVSDLPRIELLKTALDKFSDFAAIGFSSADIVETAAYRLSRVEFNAVNDLSHHMRAAGLTSADIIFEVGRGGRQALQKRLAAAKRR